MGRSSLRQSPLSRVSQESNESDSVSYNSDEDGSKIINLSKRLVSGDELVSSVPCDERPLIVALSSFVNDHVKKKCLSIGFDMVMQGPLNNKSVWEIF